MKNFKYFNVGFFVTLGGLIAFQIYDLALKTIQVILLQFGVVLS